MKFWNPARADGHLIRYVDRQSGAPAPVYFRRPRIVDPDSAPRSDPAYADRHLSQRRYPSYCRGVRLYRVEPGRDPRGFLPDRNAECCGRTRRNIDYGLAQLAEPALGRWSIRRANTA